MPQLEHEQTDADQKPASTSPPAGPCAMVIFGGTGDLTARKLFPALYNLIQGKMLTDDFAILGVGRNDYSDEEYRTQMGEKLDSFATGKLDPKLREWLLQRVFYVCGDFKDQALYKNIKEKLAELDKKCNTKGNYF